ncbi:MAG: DEAD/DEAH box helicase [Cloacibacillus porcorum]|uniref:DEAD/DEAH box helicase n=1 Tax=Cloacibacillus porcorum TaxID=1197717 RepID=UPI0023F54B6D|nr:DEAD/DEAH box helicase [Cloacibacillus porcorum]MCD7877211.1 DEAD/DEAH box helicase [Cloacibacillus porcorum]
MTQEIQKRFSYFNLNPALLKAIERKGFEHPMPVQTAVLEDESVMDNDVIVQAKTGSGKTLAFALPLMNQIDAREKMPQIIVLSPTRELAQQTAREFAWLGADLGVRVATLVGGLDMERQIRALRDGASVVVGTPGRILDHLRRCTLKTEDIKSVVLDEGDHMLDMGFHDEMEAILEAMVHVERTWLFSATMPPEVLSLTKQYLNAPKKISLVSDITSHSEITQKAYIIPSRRRFEGLTNVLIWENPSKSLIFCGTRAETQDIADKLCDIGFRATAIHGDMSQRERNNALSALRGGRVSILVATDVAARGLDIDAVSHVLQYGLPQNLEAFVHRSGRTGRAGHEGSNLILLTAREARQFKGMIMHSGSKLKLEWIPAPDASEIEGQARIRFENNILEHALESNEFESWAMELLKREEAPTLVSGLLAKAYGDQPSGYSIRDDVQFEMDREKGRRDSGAPRGDKAPGRKERFQRPDMTGGVAVQFAQGRDNGWEVGPLLGALCRNIGIGREDVGNIKLRDTSATVELSPRGAALLDARKERLERDGLTVSSVKPSTGGERRGSYRSDSKPPRRDGGFRRDRDRAGRRRFSK